MMIREKIADRHARVARIFLVVQSIIRLPGDVRPDLR
jgi:hypothetical protein